MIVVVVLLVGVVGAAVAGFSYLHWCQGASGSQDPISFTIPGGATGAEVISSLHSNGVIRCDALARYIARARSTEFQAGDYKVQTNMTLDAALDRLGEGPIVRTVSLTIPEGWTLEQIAAEVSQRLDLSRAVFLRLAGSGQYSVPPYLPAGTPTTEGFLFPSTYTFPREGLSEKMVLQRLLDEFNSQAAKLPWGNTKQLGITPYEAVTVASLIEREAAIASERPRIAAVIYNRIKMHEILGIDASNEYIDPNPDDGLTTSDLKIDSPYNLRLESNAGKLPPTPISNPGLASLKAALTPTHTSDWLYVLCSSDGHHQFTDSYAEFQRLKAQCL